MNNHCPRCGRKHSDICGIPRQIVMGFSIGGLGISTFTDGAAFRPTSVKADHGLQAAKRGVAAEIVPLNDALAELIPEAKDDEHLSREVEIIRAHLQRLAEVS